MDAGTEDSFQCFQLQKTIHAPPLGTRLQRENVPQEHSLPIPLPIWSSEIRDSHPAEIVTECCVDGERVDRPDGEDSKDNESIY